MSRTPEEIAWNVIEENIYNVPTNGQLKRLLASAIREAIAEEREACYQIAVKENTKHLNFVTYTGSGYIARNAGMDASFRIMEDICERSEKASPELTDEADSKR